MEMLLDFVLVAARNEGLFDLKLQKLDRAVLWFAKPNRPFEFKARLILDAGHISQSPQDRYVLNFGGF